MVGCACGIIVIEPEPNGRDDEGIGGGVDDGTPPYFPPVTWEEKAIELLCESNNEEK